MSGATDIRPEARDELLDPMFVLVRKQLLALELPEVRSQDITATSLLIEELGLDSLRFVDLTVNLEDALHVDELPMQAWVDEELEAGRPLTVAGLVAACKAALAAQAS